MKRPLTWETSLNQYLDSLTPYLAEKTIIQYRSTLKTMLNILHENGRETLPNRISEEDVRFLLEELKHLNARSRRWYISILGTYADHYQNTIVRTMRISWPQDRTINVDWLDPMDVGVVMEAAETPLERLVIHLELCLGLRRVEVIRLQVEDCKSNYLHVRGKGRSGGKWRTMPYHPETRRIIEAWVDERDRLVAEAKKYRPNIIVPGNLIIWKRFSRKAQLGSYSEKGTGLDKKVIHPIRERLGLEFGNHTLRRTCGRTLWMADVRNETISKILGHEDTSTTLRYIGVNLDDMSDAMSALYDYQNGMKKRR